MGPFLSSAIKVLPQVKLVTFTPHDDNSNHSTKVEDIIEQIKKGETWARTYHLQQY